jgi:hypothetical protein
MSTSEDSWLDFFQEFEKRKNQYSFVEVKGIIHLEGNTWKNVVTKFYPKADSEPSPSTTYDYDSTIIFSRSIEVEKSIEVLKNLSNEKKISLPELKEYEAPTNLTREKISRYEVINSYSEWEGFVFEWPSILYTTADRVNISNSLLNKPLISLNLPLYPYLKYAIEKDVGLRETWSGKIVIVVPDYRARIRLVLCSKNKIKVKLDVKRENLKNLLCKYCCVSEKRKFYQDDIKFEKPEREVEFEDEINEFYFYLFTKKGERIDYKEGTYLEYLFYSTPGIEIELDPESIKSIIENGENEHVEFKEKIPKDTKKFVESIVAFANRRGGTIFLGVDDKRNLKGATSEDLDEKRLRDIVRDNCEPIIEINTRIVEIDSKKIVLINIPEGKNKPYFVKDKGPFIRVGSSNKPMRREEFDQIYNEKVKPSIVTSY